MWETKSTLKPSRNFLSRTKLELSVKGRLSKRPFPSFNVTVVHPANRGGFPSRGFTSIQFPVTPLLPSSTTTVTLAEDSGPSDTIEPVLVSIISISMGDPSEFFRSSPAKTFWGIWDDLAICTLKGRQLAGVCSLQTSTIGQESRCNS